MAGISGPWVLVVFTLAALAAVFHYWNRRQQPRWWLPLVARFASYALLGLLLLNPISEGLESERRKPRVWLVVDRSSSMRDDTSAMERWVRACQVEWGGKVDVQRGNLSGNVHFDGLGLDEKGRTRLDALSESLELQPRPVDAVILLTDGQWNAGVHPRYTAWPNQTKLYTVPFGNAQQKAQLTMERWSMNPEVRVNEPFHSEWAYRIRGEFPSTAALVLTHKGKVLSKLALGQRSSATLGLDLTLSDLGDQVLEAQVIDANGQVWYRDQKTVRVIETGKKVLVLYKELHADVGALVRSLKASKGLGVYAQSVREPIGTEVDLIIQMGLTTSQLDALPVGVPIWHFPAPEEASISYTHRTRRELPQSGTWQASGYWTPESEVFIKGIEEYPPLNMPVLKSGSLPESALHLKQFAMGSQTSFPLGVFYSVSGVEEAWFFGKGIWRWRAACYRRNQSFDPFDRWVLSVTSRLMARSGARNALQMRCIPEKPHESEAFSVRLWKTGPDGQISGEGEFDMHLEKASKVGRWERLQQANLSRNAEVWQAAFQGLDTGDYRLVATWNKGSSRLEHALTWKVLSPALEPQLGADTALLKQWALDHQGAMLSNRYNGGIELPESRIEEKWSEWPWREQGLLLLLMAFLLGLEWFMRKWLGHI